MKNIRFTIFAVLLISLISSCNAQQSIETKKMSSNYPETILPKDTTKLWLAEGNPTSQIVTIFLQGGPKDELNFAARGKSIWRYLPNYENYYNIHLHQANTLNTDIFRFSDDFTMDDARKEVDNTSEILYRAIKYFKDKGKTVWVLGHSYGAFIIPHYLATRPSLADKYVIVSGRIDDPKEALTAHIAGYNGVYEDGTNFISEKGRDFSDYNEAAKKYYLGKQRLKAAIGEISYSEALKDIELSNSIYVYNDKDDRVGGLTKQELLFLETKGFQIYKTKYPHGETIYGLVDALTNGILKL